MNDNSKNIRFEWSPSMNEKVWEKRVCPICGTEFYCRKKYSKITCSNECYKEYINKHKEEINKKRSDTLNNTNKFKSIETKRQELAKARETCLKRYGVDMYQKTDEYRDKMSKIFKNKDWSERSLKSNEKLKVKYENICNNDNLELLEFRSRFDCTVKCKKCGNIFDIHVLGYLSDYSQHNLCRECFPNKNTLKSTLPQKFIQDILDENGIVYTLNNRSLISPYEIDIYIPSLKIGIEVNGNYWHSEVSCGKDKKYHVNKTMNAYEKGIKLIQIFEDEIIYHPDIVKSRINNLLGNTKTKIGARKTEIRELSFNEKNEFLNKNHIDGDSLSSYNIGLIYEGEIVSVATFGKRKISGKVDFELIRFASKLNTDVIGGFSKLFNYFIKTYKPEKITTFADIRWSGMDYEHSFYNKYGFNFVKYTSPNYFYEDRKMYLKRINRMNFTKQKLIKEGNDPNKTEFEIMIEKGYDRIWDCGSMKFEYISKV